MPADRELNAHNQVRQAAMSAPPYPANPLVQSGSNRSECVYRSLTLVAMFLLLASLWVF
jgi:hypothetical protein